MSLLGFSPLKWFLSGVPWAACFFLLFKEGIADILGLPVCVCEYKPPGKCINTRVFTVNHEKSLKLWERREIWLLII